MRAVSWYSRPYVVIMEWQWRTARGPWGCRGLDTRQRWRPPLFPLILVIVGKDLSPGCNHKAATSYPHMRCQLPLSSHSAGDCWHYGGREIRRKHTHHRSRFSLYARLVIWYFFSFWAFVAFNPKDKFYPPRRNYQV